MQPANAMESVMQRSEAAKWFWPFVLVAALAAAIVIAVSTYVPPKATPGEPELRMLVAVAAAEGRATEPTPVVFEAPRIVVIGHRSPSILDRLEALLPQRKQSS